MSRPGVRLRPIDLTDIHVLVVDDHDDTLEFFNAALQAFGAKVLTARTVDDGQTGSRLFTRRATSAAMRSARRAFSVLIYSAAPHPFAPAS